MTQVHILHRQALRCYRTTNGLDRIEFGCVHETPREAIAHSDTLGVPGPVAIAVAEGVDSLDGRAGDRSEVPEPTSLGYRDLTFFGPAGQYVDPRRS